MSGKIRFDLQNIANIYICSLSFLEQLPHNIEGNGYEIFVHNHDDQNIFKSIGDFGERSDSEIQVNVALSPNKLTKLPISELQMVCRNYFGKNYLKLAEEDPLLLPTVISDNFKEVEKVRRIADKMQNWCHKTNEMSNIKGIVCQSYSILDHLKWLGYAKDIVLRSLHIKEFSPTPIIIVYNPNEKVVFLIRQVEGDNVKNDIRLSSADVKMFMLLYCNELQNSGIKLIPLLVTDKVIELKCEQCMEFFISVNDFDDVNNWWNKKVEYFQIKSKDNANEVFSTAFLAKLIGFMAATRVCNCMPTFSKDSYKQMEEASLLLTREQQDIIDSKAKHMIIKGSFGSGKSIIARVKMQKLLDNLSEKDVLYYICYDSRSEFFNSIEMDKVNFYRNNESRKLTDIIQEILEKNQDKEDIHIFVDEYDGEDLDTKEAETLDNYLTKNKKLKDSFIFLMVQPIRKERRTITKKHQINDTSSEAHMFGLLKTMKMKELTLVMRNSVEINRLVTVTKKVLEKQETVIHGERKKLSSRQKILRLASKVTNEEGNEKNAEKNQPKEFDAKDEKQKGLNQNDPAENDDEKSFIQGLRLDEACDISGSAIRNNSKGTKMISKFSYVVAKDTGHSINSELPKLIEVTDYENETELGKVLSLLYIFKKLKIPSSNPNNKHVILHFDTATDKIPELFYITFKLLGISDQVTNCFEDFHGKESSKEKHILVCSYLQFRGLEHPRITVVISRDIYYLQHYLVESIARCTNDLDVIVLEKSETLTRITDEWKSAPPEERIIRHWKTTINTEKERKNFETVDINGFDQCITIYLHSKGNLKIQNDYSNLKNQDNEEYNKKMGSKKVCEATKVVRKR